jgi:hypothetical protein
MSKAIQEAIKNLSLLEDVCSQINTYQSKIMHYVYNSYLVGKTQDTYDEFKNKIVKRHRPLYDEDSEDDEAGELPDEKRCNYNIWNKGKIRRCKLARYKTETNCKKHANNEDLFDADSESSDSEESEEASDSSN